MAELSAQDRIIAVQAGALFGGLIMEYEVYRECEDSERDEVREAFAARLRGLRAQEKEAVIVFMLDILHKIGPEQVILLLESYTAAQKG